MIIANQSVDLMFAQQVEQIYRPTEGVKPLFQASFSGHANSVSSMSYVALPTDASTGMVRALGVDEFAEHFAKLAEVTVDSSLWLEGSELPNDVSVVWGKIILQKFREYALPPSRVVATADGGIAICVVRGDKYADIECLNSGEILAVISDRKSSPIVWEIKHRSNEISLSVSRIRQFIAA